MNSTERADRQAAWEGGRALTRRQALGLLGLAGAVVLRPELLWAQRLAGTEVKLGAAFPMTGMWTDWGRKDKVALDIAMEELNQAGGVGGLPIRYVLEDTGSKPQEAASIIRKMATDHRVLAIIGPFSSSEAEVAFPVGNQLKVSMIAPASSKPGIGAANRPWAFRMNVDEGRMAALAVRRFVKEYHVKTAAVIHDVKDAVGQVLGSRVLPAVLKQLGVRIVNEGNYVTYQTRDIDFSAQVTKLKGMTFDGLVFGGVYIDAVTFLREARRQGLRQPMVGGNPLMHENFPRLGGEIVDGTIAPTPFWPGAPEPRVQNFVKKFAARAPAAGLPPTPEMVNANVYDTVSLLADIIKRGGVTNRPEDLARDREHIMQALTRTEKFPGVAGSFGFNKDGDAVKDVYVMMAKGGRWVRLE